MASISDVAKHAGVSVATVSRVINGNDRVQELTKQKVESSIKALNYEPNLIARNLRKEESRVILILTPNITNPYYNRIITGIFDEARKNNYNAFISTVETKAEYKNAFGMIAQKQADGAILLAAESNHNWIEEHKDRYPMVLCCEFDQNTTIPYVAIDNYAAATDAVSYLIEQGHKKIATISSENDYNSTHLRLKAYKDAIEKQEIKLNLDYIKYASKDYSLASAKKATKELLSLPDPPTAIFCISDTVALGCIIQAQEMRVRVPEQLSVVGFDDVENTTMLHPYITSVAQPCYDIGVTGARKLLKIMKESKTKPYKILPHELIKRESVAPMMFDV